MVVCKKRAMGFLYSHKYSDNMLYVQCRYCNVCTCVSLLTKVYLFLLILDHVIMGKCSLVQNYPVALAYFMQRNKCFTKT